jgi:O-6-methylguanine DNA methyltransferase
VEKLAYTFANLPWCNLLVATGARGLAAVRFVRNETNGQALASLARTWEGQQLVRSEDENRRAVEELNAYAAGELCEFAVPLDLRGTKFQLAVWRALLEIPYGETRTYGEVARAIGHPQSYRAVGMANHSNPVAILVPCHRVVGSNRTLVGYGGGLDLKKTLLEMERRHAPSNSSPGGSRSLPLWE